MPSSTPVPVLCSTLIHGSRISKKYGSTVVNIPMHHDTVNITDRITCIQEGMEEQWVLFTSTAKRPSDVPDMQLADSLPKAFSNILPDPSVGNQMSLINVHYHTEYDLDNALEEWRDNTDFYPAESTPISYQETSHSPSVVTNSIQSTFESAVSTDDEESICYGMVSDHHMASPGSLT